LGNVEVCIMKRRNTIRWGIVGQANKYDINLNGDASPGAIGG
jgi:hypothetical protein